MSDTQNNRQRAINMLTEMALPLDEGRIQMIADMLKVWKVGDAALAQQVEELKREVVVERLAKASSVAEYEGKLTEMRVALQKLVNDRRKRATSYQDLKDAETHLAEAERALVNPSITTAVGQLPPNSAAPSFYRPDKLVRP